jgi:hypothetical protein
MLTRVLASGSGDAPFAKLRAGNVEGCFGR